MSKVLHLPRNLHFEVKPLRSLAPVTTCRLFGPPKTRGYHPELTSLRSRNALRRFREQRISWTRPRAQAI